MPIMTAEEAAEAGKNLDFAQVWAALMENRVQQAKTEALIVELSAKATESSARTDAQIERMAKKVEEVSLNVGGLNRSMGELIETLIAARLWEKFPAYNLARAYQRVPIYDHNNVTKTDIDILLSDTDTAMAVEVKRELDKKEDVDKHTKRMQLIRQYPPAETVGKKLLGAMAGGVVDPDVRDYAYESGFFVLELAGDSVRLLEPPKDFHPQEW